MEFAVFVCTALRKRLRNLFDFQSAMIQSVDADKGVVLVYENLQTALGVDVLLS